jgi:hypothetical protein
MILLSKKYICWAMKKTAILGITAFYLLLTSGMLVCAAHCTTEKLLVKHGMQMASVNPCKHCNNCKKSGCSKKHGNFVIKENLKPGYDIHFVQTFGFVPQIQLPDFLLKHPIV